MIEVISTPVEITPAPPVEYWVQVSKQPSEKSGYRTQYRKMNLSAAEFLYHCINNGRGQKKRLVVFSPLFGKKILARSFS